MLYHVMRHCLVMLLMLFWLGVAPVQAAESIHEAVSRGDLPTVTRLLEGDANLLSSHDQEFGGTPLHWAIAGGRLEITQYLLDEGADPNQRNNDGRTALHLAAALGQTRLVEMVLAKGAQLQARDTDDNTPLHLAAALGQLATVTLLVENGADVGVLNRAHRTPRMWAEAQGKAPIAARLREAEQRLGKTGVIPVGAYLGQERINPADGAIMVWVPETTFSMGRSFTEGREDEYPRHAVTLDGYWIYKYEVSVAQYRAYCTATGQALPPPAMFSWGEDDRPVSGTEQDPMVGVTWQEAVGYARAAGATLPTEAQWELAACGTEGREYPWGMDWDPNKSNNAYTRGQEHRVYGTVPVGTYPEDCSPYGVMDLAGNAWEWCADWYDADYYGNSPDRNPAGPEHGEERAARGGCWLMGIDDDFPASTRRNAIRPDDRLSFGGGGFRCVVMPRN